MKYVIITGAGSGIGAQTCKDLDEDGFNTILVGRNLAKLENTKKKLKNNSLIIPCDLSKKEDIDQFDQLPQSILPHISGLINNAGIFIRKTFMNTDSNDWHQLFSTNLLGPSLLSQKIIKLLKNSLSEHKFIINISSTAGMRPVESTSAYGALKSAFNHLTQVMALEHGADKICINSISPGIIDTPIHNFSQQDQESLNFVNNLQPLGRMGKPKDISQMVRFLCSKQSEWVTGSNFTIDGGLSLK